MSMPVLDTDVGRYDVMWFVLNLILYFVLGDNYWIMVGGSVIIGTGIGLLILFIQYVGRGREG